MDRISVLKEFGKGKVKMSADILYCDLGGLVS